MPNLRLVIRQGPLAGQVFELQQPIHNVGRSKENDIQIDDLKISRRHANLTLTPTGYVLQDLGSTNGTFVNNQRITAPVAIQPGDVIGFGDNVVIDVQGFVGAPQMAGPARAAVAPPQQAYAPQQQAYAPPQPAYVPPPPPPPAFEAEPQSHTGRNIAIGCGILLALLVCALVAGYLMYQFAPQSIAVPICDAVRPLPVIGSLCP